MNRVSLRKAAKHPLLVLGATLIFGSWLSQSYFVPKWNLEIDHLSQSQRLIETQFLEVTMWQIELIQRQSEEPRNDELYRVALLNSFQTLSTQLTWEMVRIATEEEAPVHFADRTERDAAALKAFQNKDTAQLEKLLNGISALRQINQSAFDKEFFTQMFDARQNELFWNWVFLALYAIGMVILAVHWFTSDDESQADVGDPAKS